MYKNDADVSAGHVKLKETKINELEQHIDTIRKTKSDNELNRAKGMEVSASLKVQDQDDVATSFQIKLNGKDAIINRMENNLLEMARKMDDFK